MRFETSDLQRGLKGEVLYRKRSSSFDFASSNPRRVRSAPICVGSLQLEVDLEDNRLLCAWGFWPMESWRRSQLELDINRLRTGVVVKDVEFEHAVGKMLIDSSDACDTASDSSTGWVRIGWNQFASSDVGGFLAGFADDTVAELVDGTLVAIWLRPRFIEADETSVLD